jgi:hypothetical protein
MTIFQPESHHDARRGPSQQKTRNFESERSEVTVDMAARCLMGLAELDKGTFERLGRYEVALAVERG